MKRTVYVTEKHIKNGKRYSFDKCMVALALLDAGFAGPLVNPWACCPGKCTISTGGYAHVLCPSSILERIRKWEEGNSIEPFQFDVLCTRALQITQIRDAKNTEGSETQYYILFLNGRPQAVGNWTSLALENRR